MRRASWVSALVAAVVIVGLVVFRDAHAGDAEKKLALELIHFVMPKESYVSALEQVSVNMVASANKDGVKISEKDAAKISAAVLDLLPYEELAQWSAELYSARFTAAELNELLKFYNTPTGKKSARLMPELSGEVGKKMGSLTAERMAAVRKKHGLK